MGKVLTDNEEEILTEALKTPVNEASVQLGLLFMELSMINSFVNQIDETTTPSKIRYFYHETKTYLTERIKGFVEVSKEQKDNFIEEPGDWETYLDCVKTYTDNLENTKKINENTVILQNMWNSLYPIINGFVKKFTNR